MQRRQFLKSSLVTLSGSLAARRLSALSLEQLAPPAAPDPRVERVLAMFKCHFDAGFIDTQAHVVNRYFTQFFPQAIQTAEELRHTGGHRYVWTTGSWLLYEYLEQASAADRRRMEQAIADGDIAWHALPFSWQTEMMDRSLIAGGLALSRSLDQRFGRTTTGAKMTDVPGHTRGLIRPLADHGVSFLDIGVNGGSTPAELPPLFLWKEPEGASIAVMYHHEYGSIARVPGSTLAVAVVVRGDNSGPHTPEEIADIHNDLGQRFPNAHIEATDLTEIANAIRPHHDHLPVVTQEIGDTWIYGVASDPLKVARYRELCRLRQGWIAKGQFQTGDATDLALLRHLLLEPEHTWGTDTKTWLDFDHYTPHDLASMLDTKNYKVVEFSWQEKRQDLFDGIATLPAPLRDEARAAMASLAPKLPSPAGDVHPAAEPIETEHFLVHIDPATGAIHRLKNKQTGREWASPQHPLALFCYQTLSQQDYQQFLASYLITKADWAQKDFGKPNIERFGAVNQTWSPRLDEVRVGHDGETHRITARLHIEDAEALKNGRAAFPRTLILELLLPEAESVVHLNFHCMDKAATRMPEAMWLTFNPAVSDPNGWTMDKSGQPVSPFDVVTAGGRHQHAVMTGFAFSDAQGTFQVETLDAPLIALGERSPLNFSRSQPDLSNGIHCGLFNNGWGTNYIMWFGEDMRFRFVLRA
ncbi:MAG TPA: DUF5054 domain-containing protein [Acidobacteriaceae bacterium]|jgi:hypothetical protein|nr:DUF5054 domain-containing protein [Acidobacteriaceae bacterium]